MNEYRGAVIVIPSRNRPDIAPNAIRSVLAESHRDDVQVVVSDNSTIEENRRLLERACAQLRDDRLHYIRPPAPLPMPDHWEWAMNTAMARFEANHFSVLTDRMIARVGL